MGVSLGVSWLDTESRPFRIDEVGRADLGEKLGAAYGICDLHHLAVARRPV